tara:strand:- start:48 stop:473 length:426 start_codon:yes stop_codon:yes gene_type:complete
MSVEQQANQFVSRSQGAISNVSSTNASLALASVSNSIRSNTITDNLNGKTLHLCVDVTTAFAATASVTVAVEGSLDDTNHAVLATPETNFLPQNTGPRFYSIDLTKVNGIPYFSIHFNGGKGITAGNIGTTGKLSFSYYTT